MASFYEWTLEQPSDDPDVVKLAETSGSGLKCLDMTLFSAGEKLAAIALNTGSILADRTTAVAHVTRSALARWRQIVSGCTNLGEIGALLRREGIYSSFLATWRKKRAAIE
jgi:hypothetical protein